MGRCGLEREGVMNPDDEPPVPDVPNDPVEDDV